MALRSTETPAPASGVPKMLATVGAIVFSAACDANGVTPVRVGFGRFKQVTVKKQQKKLADVAVVAEEA